MLSRVSQTARWPLLLALLVFAGVTGLHVRDTALDCGELVYPLDDTYIHMAMARNLAFHGVWGVTPTAFAAASSSPAWTALLAGVFKVAGARDVWPLVLDLILGGLLLALVDRRLAASGLFARGRAATLVAFVLLVPLPMLAFSGHEHLLQILVSLAFVEALASDRAPLVLAALVTLVRYEGALLVGAGALWRAARGRPAQGLALLFAGAAGPLALGAVNKAHGWFLLPNSVLLKGNRPSLASWSDAVSLLGGDAYRALAANPHLIVLVVGAALLAASALTRSSERSEGLAGADEPRGLEAGAFLITTVTHLQLARTGWLYRYEAYLVAWGLVLLAPPMIRAARAAPSRARVALALLALLAAAPLVTRGTAALSSARSNSRALHQLIAQEARFLARHYAGEAVAIHDIGMPNWLATLDCVDVWGLGTLEPLQLMLARKYDSRAVADLVRRRNARVFVGAEEWFSWYGGGGPVPPEWVKVGELSIDWRPERLNPRLAFFATSQAEVERLRAAFTAFAAELPPGVKAHLRNP